MRFRFLKYNQLNSFGKCSTGVKNRELVCDLLSIINAINRVIFQLLLQSSANLLRYVSFKFFFLNLKIVHASQFCRIKRVRLNFLPADQGDRNPQTKRNMVGDMNGIQW